MSEATRAVAARVALEARKSGLSRRQLDQISIAEFALMLLDDEVDSWAFVEGVVRQCREDYDSVFAADERN